MLTARACLPPGGEASVPTIMADWTVVHDYGDGVELDELEEDSDGED